MSWLRMERIKRVECTGNKAVSKGLEEIDTGMTERKKNNLLFGYRIYIMKIAHIMKPIPSFVHVSRNLACKTNQCMNPRLYTHLSLGKNEWQKWYYKMFIARFKRTTEQYKTVFHKNIADHLCLVGQFF